MADTAPNLDILAPERTLMSGLGARASALPTFATADTDKVLAKATAAKDPSLLPLMERKAQIADATSQALQIENEGKAVLDQAKTKLQSAASQREAQEYNSLVQNFGEVEKTAPELHPTKENMQSLASMFSLIGLIGTAMGKGPGNYSAMNALKSMTGMMQGWQQGDQARWNREVQEYDKSVAEFKTRLDSAQRKYNMGLQKLATDREAAKADMDMALAELGSPLLKATRDRQGYEAVAKTLNELSKDAAKVYTETGAERRQQQKLGFERGERLAKESFEVKLEDIKQSNRIKEAIFKQGLQDEDYKVTNGVDKDGNMVVINRKGETKSLEGIKPSAKMIAEMKGQQKLDKEAMPLVQGLVTVENLQRQLRDPEIKTGLAAKFSPVISKINSLSGTADASEWANAVTSTLTGNDKTTVFLKDALLASYEIARESKGGRLTVQDMRVDFPVLDPTNYSPETYNEILEGRRKNLYDKLQRQYKYTPQQIEEATKPLPYTRFGATQGESESKVATEADISETMKAMKMTRTQVLKALKDRGYSVPEA